MVVDGASPTPPTGTSSGPTRSPTRPGRPWRGRTVCDDHCRGVTRSNRAPTAVDDHYSPHAGDALGERPRRPRERRRPGRRFDHRGAVVVAFERDPEHGRRRGFTYTPDEDFVGTDLVLLHAQGRPRRGRTVRDDNHRSPPRPEPGAVDRTGPLRHGYRRQLLVAAPGLLGNDRDLDDDSMILATTGQGAPRVGERGHERRVQLLAGFGLRGRGHVPLHGPGRTRRERTTETVTVTVVDVDGSGTIATDADAVTFGDVAARTEVTATVTVTNVGGSPLTFTGADLTRRGAGAYAVVAGDQSASLSTGGRTPSRCRSNRLRAGPSRRRCGSTRTTRDAHTRRVADGDGRRRGGGSTGSGSGGSPDSSGGSSSSPGPEPTPPTTLADQRRSRSRSTRRRASARRRSPARRRASRRRSTSRPTRARTSRSTASTSRRWSTATSR